MEIRSFEIQQMRDMMFVQAEAEIMKWCQSQMADMEYTWRNAVISGSASYEMGREYIAAARLMANAGMISAEQLQNFIFLVQSTDIMRPPEAVAPSAPVEVAPVAPVAPTAPAAPSEVSPPPTVVAPVNVSVPPVVVPAPVVNVSVPPAEFPSASEIGQAIAPALSVAGTGVIAGILSQAGNLGHGFASGRNMCLGSTGQVLAQQLLSALAPAGVIAALESPGFRDRVTDPISSWLFDDLLLYPERSGHISPEDGPAVARRMLERALALGISAHIVSLAAEANTALKTMGIGYLSAFLADCAGFGRIAAATMGALEMQAMGLPMRYHVNEKVRSVLPSMGELSGLVSNYMILGEDRLRSASASAGAFRDHDHECRRAFLNWGRYHGLSDSWLYVMYDASHRPITERGLRNLADQGVFDEGYFRFALAQSGYDPTSIEILLEGLSRRASGELRQLGIGVIISRYREGLDDEVKLANHLQMMGISPVMIPRYKIWADLSAGYDDYMDYLGYLKDLVSKGEISPRDMEQMLVSYGVRPDKAERLAAREAVKLLPRRKAGPVGA
jgi:hypothetical protein